MRWRPRLGVLSVLALVLGVAGGVLSWSAWSAPTSIDGTAALVGLLG